jgi:hypothetical protein
MGDRATELIRTQFAKDVLVKRFCDVLEEGRHRLR